ncbi:receptor-associated protein [Arthroderma uncinatum]|uniref:receptor-associated protein n=1 Tax=Arthroderma uncinatum TaxID=74035 RepID=UPI00144AD445|nr:receptor-associated protein [Arthroderma uncinatum]KAF3481277.1 receptor-associated protein [Arthroderma uncinatum]
MSAKRSSIPVLLPCDASDGYGQSYTKLRCSPVVPDPICLDIGGLASNKQLGSMDPALLDPSGLCHTLSPPSPAVYSSILTSLDAAFALSSEAFTRMHRRPWLPSTYNHRQPVARIMTLYFTLVFVLLVTEMAIFVGLIVPLPFTVKRKLFTFISESPIVAKLQYGMKITFIFILILFIDSVNRVYRVQIELTGFDSANAGHAIGTERMEVQARKFYSQRNMYLCGFTLFLSLILNRTYTMILDILRLEDKVKMYEGDKRAGGKDSAKLAAAGDIGEIGRLKNELKARENDIAALKKQSEGLSREYNKLGDEFTQKDATPKKDR